MPIPTVEQLIHDPIAHYPRATVACFDPTTGELPRRRLDKPRLRPFLEKLGSLSVPSILIGASTGHGHLRTAEELAEWFAAAAEANLSNTMKTALLRPEDDREANQRLVELLARLDYRVVYVRPGVDLPAEANDDEIVANMQPLVRLIAEAGLAVGLYSISNVSGVAMSDETAARLVAGPGGDRVVAVKVTEADYERSTRRFVDHPQLQRLKVVQGWDPHLARALKEGGARMGVTSGAMSFAVFQYFHMLEAAEQQEWSEVVAAQRAVTILFGAMQDDPRKFADLQRAKFIMGLGHPMLGEVRSEQIERVMQALESVPRGEDRRRLARSLDLMGDGPLHERLVAISADASDRV